jgi:hypothetical protein
MSESSELGSLGQAARGNQLKSARWIMIAVGVLSLIVNGILVANVQNEINSQIAELARQGMVADPSEVESVRFQNQMTYGIGAALGAVFIVLGIAVYRFPVICTVLGLVLYVGSIIGFAVIAPASLAQGLIIKILITVALAKSVSSAIAYQKDKDLADIAV